MPLLRRQKFVKLSPPRDLKPDEEVFYCELTGEIFRDYEFFFERVILCNSLVWTCEITGRTGLTYQEAQECESHAREQLQSIPTQLSKILLHLATMTHRSRLNYMNDDVFIYVKDRFFIGDTVEFISNNNKMSGKITSITPPPASNPSSAAASSDSDSDVVCLDDIPKKCTALTPVDVDKVTYSVQSSKKVHSLQKKHMSRKKGAFTRDKCKLFLKQHCDPFDDGIWRVKDKYLKKYNLGKMLFSDYFIGSMPMFTISEVKKKPSVPKKKPQEIDLNITEDDLIRKAKEMRERNKSSKQKQKQLKKAVADSANTMTMEEKVALYEKIKSEKAADKQAQREQMKKLMEEQRAQKREDIAKERERRKEEKRIQDAIQREYNRPREDLSLDDLKALPRPLPIDMALDAAQFGDVMMILEYLNCFTSLFDLHDDFPNGISLDDLCSALLTTSINGLYMDLIQFLLTVIIRLQEEEDTESGEDHFKYKASLSDIPEAVQNNLKNTNLVINSVEYAQKPEKCFGNCLDKLQIDSYTITEVLRLQLLGSCARSCNPVGCRYRYQQRGGYGVMDDVALDLIKYQPELLEKLNTENMFDFSPEHKLCILNILTHQLLTFVGCRDVVDDSFERLRQIRMDLRTLQIQEIKRDKDEATHKYRKKLEERQHEVERARLEAQNLPIPDELKPKPVIAPADPDIEPERVSGRSKGKKREDEEIPEDINWDTVTPEQRDKWKQLYKSKEADLIQLLSDLQRCAAVVPLGRDRTFRRYWRFKSVPGLFIENNEPHVSKDYFEILAPQCENDLTKGDNAIVSNNKENDKSAENVPNGNVEPTVNGRGDEDMDVDGDLGCVTVKEQIADFNVTQWSFYEKPEDIDKLINCLNPRGFREGPLKAALIEHKKDILTAVEACPVNSLYQNYKALNKKDVKIQSVKSRNRNTKGHVQNDSAKELMELSLREQLLDIEERIFVGTLGALKNIDSREIWRSSLENGSYNPTGDTHIGISEANENDEHHASVVVADLSKALAQIYDSVEPKYLNIPLGENDPKRRAPKKKVEATSCDNSEDSVESSSRLSCRWLASLATCTSLSQVFLHLSVLESSVAWSKSALHARCKLCRRGGDAEKMLLCDGCDRGHHMYCLKPAMKSIPRGDWYCPECKPKQTVHLTPRKNRRKSMPAEDEDSSDQEESSDDSQSSDDDDDDDSSDASSSDDDDDDDDSDSSSLSEDDESQETVEDDDTDSEREASPKETKIKIFGGKKVAARKVECNGSGRSTPTQGRRSNNPTPKSSRANSRAGTPTTEPKTKKGRHSWAGNEMRTGGRTAAKTGAANKRSQSANRTSRSTKRTYAESSMADENEGAPSKRSATQLSDTLIDNMKECKELVKRLTDHDDAEMFMFPVTKRDVPDYHEIVKRPMDFGTIRVKVNNMEYETVHEFVEDIKQVFTNCEIYNHVATPEYKQGQRLCAYFVQVLKELNIHSVITQKASPKGADSKRSSRRH